VKQNKDLDKKKIAERALKEAELRRKTNKFPTMPKEYGGRDGLEPTRYKDWEVKGIVSDF